MGRINEMWGNNGMGARSPSETNVVSTTADDTTAPTTTPAPEDVVVPSGADEAPGPVSSVVDEEQGKQPDIIKEKTAAVPGAQSAMNPVQPGQKGGDTTMKLAWNHAVVDEATMHQKVVSVQEHSAAAAAVAVPSVRKKGLSDRNLNSERGEDIIGSVQRHGPVEENQGYQTPGAYPVEGSSTATPATSGGGNVQQQPSNTQRQQHVSFSNNHQVVTNDNNNNNISDRNLAEAQPVVDHQQEAQPIEDHELAQRAQKEEQDRQYKRAAIALLTLSCLVVAVMLAVWFGTKSSDRNTNTDNDANVGLTTDINTTEMPTPAPTSQEDLLLKPPLDNLQILYDSLPLKSKVSLSDVTTAQYRAWEWLLQHQNITTLEEWRKEQIFALATFFYAFEGPKWAPTWSAHWLNDTLNECEWINTDPNLLLSWYIQYMDTTDYTLEDCFPCNAQGRIQSVMLAFLEMEPGAKPFVPRELALLTDLGFLGAALSQVVAPLVDVLPIELTQLQHLELVSIWGNGLHGTIPDYIFEFPAVKFLALLLNEISGTIPDKVPRTTGALPLRHLYLQQNKLEGTIPSKLALLSQLTSLQFWANDMTGTIPEEIWKMTNLTTLFIGQNDFHGTIPTQVGQMVNLKRLDLEQNNHFGSIPSELGLLTYMDTLYLNENLLRGTIPAQLGRNTDMRLLYLHGNFLTGSIPSQLWDFTNLGELDLSNNPLLEGQIPEEFCHLRNMNESCTYLTNHVLAPEELPCKLEFDCSERLCGCDCVCPTTSDGNQSRWLD